MNTYSPIPLMDDWCYHYAENAKTNFGGVEVDDSRWIPLPNLSDYSVTGSAQPGADWFRRVVLLEPLEACVNYLLFVDNPPDSVEVFVNGQSVGVAQARKPFSKDVTHVVALGRNVISLKLTYQGSRGSGGSFGPVRLQAVPCAEDTQYPMSH